MHPLLKWFDCDHLPSHLQADGWAFKGLACALDITIVDGPEKDVAMRKLLESKDAAVRARIEQEAGS